MGRRPLRRGDSPASAATGIMRTPRGRPGAGRLRSEDDMSDIYLDEGLFEELRDILDTEFPTLVHTFIADSALRLAEIQSAFARGLADDVRKAAHSLKGASANLGLVRLAEACRQLEDAAREGRLAGAAPGVEAVAQEQARAVAILQSRL